MTTSSTALHYRGYRLSDCVDGDVHIWYGTDMVDTVPDQITARNTIDEWMASR